MSDIYNTLELEKNLRTLFRDVVKVDADLISMIKNEYGSVLSFISKNNNLVDEKYHTNNRVKLIFDIINQIIFLLIHEKIEQKSIISKWSEFIDFVRSSIAHRERECFIIVYLDNRNRVISKKIFEHGTVNFIPIYPREILKSAICNNASSILIAHNHPSGCLTPSQSDLEMTQDIYLACKYVGITLLDHVIVSQEGNFSFKDAGILG